MSRSREWMCLAPMTCSGQTGRSRAARGGRLPRGAYGRASALEKGPADLVTEADFASQRLIARRLAEAFPEHTLLAEEEGAGPPTDYARAWRWVVDPLDGTMNFAH